MRIIAFDPSMTCTGVWIDPDRSVKLTPPKKLDRLGKLGWLTVELELVIANTTPEIHDIVAIEGYAYSSRSQRVHTLAEVGGIVRGLAAAHGFRIVEVSPSLWKANVMGPRLGSLGKKTVAERTSYLTIVERTFGKTFLTTDEADAFMIAEFVRRCATGVAWGTAAVADFSRALQDQLGSRL